MSSDTTSMKPEDSSIGSADKVLLVNDQLPTPPSNHLWEGSLTPSIIRQCFSGLEQFSGLTAPKTAHSVTLDVNTTDFEKLTPVYTPGESPDGPENDAGSFGADDWYPFGENIGFTTGLIEDEDWERVQQKNMSLGGEIGNMWDVTLFELKC